MRGPQECDDLWPYDPASAGPRRSDSPRAGVGVGGEA